MTIAVRSLLKGTIWTIGALVFVQALRLITNLVLARLLAPQLFGIMLLVNSFRSGIELLSDIGIGQNVIYHKDANDPEFYNTAWTLQAIRSVGLWLIALILAVPFSRFYQSPILTSVIPLTAFSIVFAGFSSVGTSLVLKRLQAVRHNVFDISVAMISSVAFVLFAYFSPTIWALVFGGLFGSMVGMIGSYFLLPGIKQRFYISRRLVGEIINYGKWVFLASIVYFLSTNFDRLYLAKIIPLSLLGVYGIARSMSELIGFMMLRVGNYVVFPLIASNIHTERSVLRSQLSPIRAKFLLTACLGFSLIAASSDLVIKVLYDYRYQAASWMLPLLIIGSWFSILAYINESTLFGLGRPFYSAFSNCAKFLYLLIGLPISTGAFGLIGGIGVIVFADAVRYFPLFVGQRRENFSFGAQDLLISLVTLLLIGFWEWLRWTFGWGTSFDGVINFRMS
jgi:O-antigen/teichoic acid export membrane protein